MRGEGGEIGCLSLMRARFFRALWDFPIWYTMSKSDRNCVVPGCSNRQDSSCCKWWFPSPQEIGSRRYHNDNTVWSVDFVVWTTVETSPLSVYPSLIQRIRKAVQRDLQRLNVFFFLWKLAAIPQTVITPLSRHSCVCPAHFKKFPAASVTTGKVMCSWF